MDCYYNTYQGGFQAISSEISILSYEALMIKGGQSWYLSYFGHVQKHLYIEGNLKLIVY